MKLSIRIVSLVVSGVLAAAGGAMGCGAETKNGGGSGDAGGGSTSGGAGSTNSGSSGSAGGPNALTCPNSECGPALGLPNTPCADGSIAGPTGRCLRLDADRCGWEVLECPPAGEGGAATSSSAGAASAGAHDGGVAGVGGAPLSDRCGGCDDGAPTSKVCIYQAGGPGPGRFVCATQSLCRAAGVCACILGQGTCNSMLEGGSPGYCVCDNGLD
jgi:hypothetical protein